MGLMKLLPGLMESLLNVIHLSFYSWLWTLFSITPTKLNQSFSSSGSDSARDSLSCLLVGENRLNVDDGMALLRQAKRLPFFFS